MIKYLFLHTALLALTVTNLTAQRCEVLYLQQNYDEVIKVSSPPQQEEDFLWVAHAYRAKGEMTKALEILETYADTIPTSPIEALKADINFSIGRFSDAKSYYKATSDNDASFYKLMQIYEKSGQYIKCISSINNRIDSASTNIALLNILANSYRCSKAKVMAQKTYQRLYDIDPSNQSTAYKLCILHINTLAEGDIRKACEIASKFLEKSPESMIFITIRARAYYLLEEYKRAMKDYEVLYKAGYRDETTCQRLGICEYKSHFYREARNHCLESYLLNTDNLHTNLYLGKCYQELNECEKSITYFENAEFLLQPSNEHMATLCWERHQCYIKQSEYVKADSCLRALLQYSDDIMNYYYIATNYDKNIKNKEKAIKSYALFIEKNEQTIPKKQKNSYQEIALYRIECLKEDQFWGE